MGSEDGGRRDSRGSLSRADGMRHRGYVGFVGGEEG